HLHDLQPLNELLASASKLDQVFDAGDFQAMPPGKPHQLRQPRHRSVLAQDFADHAYRAAPGELHQINGRFGMPCALQNTTRSSAQWKDMAWLHEIFR